MATTFRIGGVMTLRINGTSGGTGPSAQYEARGNFQVTPSTLRRTGVAGQDQVHGYIEEPIVPQIRGNITVKLGGQPLALQQLEQITDATVQVDLANGMTYVLNDAWVTSAFNLDAHDGQVEATFEGIQMTEYPSTTPVQVPSPGTS